MKEEIYSQNWLRLVLNRTGALKNRQAVYILKQRAYYSTSTIILGQVIFSYEM